MIGQLPRLATNEKPDIRFSMLLAVAKRGANRQKKPVVTAKKISKANWRGRRLIVSQRLNNYAKKPRQEVPRLWV